MCRWHRPEEAHIVLVDDCEGCARKAANPLLMDEAMLSIMWRTMLSSAAHPSYCPPRPRRPQSQAERDCCDVLYRLAVFLERFTPAYPWCWPMRLDTNKIDLQRLSPGQLVDLRHQTDSVIARRMEALEQLDRLLDPVDIMDRSDDATVTEGLAANGGNQHLAGRPHLTLVHTLHPDQKGA